MNENERTVESIIRAQLKMSADRVITDLERIIEQVRSDATQFDRVGSPGVSRYQGVVANIEHTLKWGFVNINTASMGSNAVEADIDRRLRAAGVEQ